MVANDLVQTASWLYKILFRLPDGSTGWCSDCLMVMQDLVQALFKVVADCNNVFKISSDELIPVVHGSLSSYFLYYSI